MSEIFDDRLDEMQKTIHRKRERDWLACGKSNSTTETLIRTSKREREREKLSRSLLRLSTFLCNTHTQTHKFRDGIGGVKETLFKCLPLKLRAATSKRIKLLKLPEIFKLVWPPRQNLMKINLTRDSNGLMRSNSLKLQLIYDFVERNHIYTFCTTTPFYASRQRNVPMQHQIQKIAEKVFP